MPQSFRPLIYLWSAVFSISAVGAMTLQAFGPVSLHNPGPDEMVPSMRPVAAAVPQAVEVNEPLQAPPTIDLESPSPAVLVAGITEVRKPQPLGIAPSPVSSQPILASVAPPHPAQSSRLKTPAAARRPTAAEETAFAPPSFYQGFAFRSPTGYIGVYTRGSDGVRVFRSDP